MKKYKRQAEDFYKYTLANVNLRTSKSFDSEVIEVIPAGKRISIIDASEDWYKVDYDGKTGYVYNKYISRTKYTWTGVTLRSYPSSESNPITTLPTKSMVQVLKVNGDWSYVMYNDEAGYIFSYFLSDDGNPPEGYDFEYFNTDMVKFANNNNIKSPTVNLIITNLENKFTYVFQKGENGSWELMYRWLSSIGTAETPTITGTFYVNGRKPYFGTDYYRVKYATRIRGSYYYHSVLFDPQGNEIINDTLGEAVSHGCIRLAVENAQWIYDNILDNTTIIIN